MFSHLKKSRVLNLPIDLHLDLLTSLSHLYFYMEVRFGPMKRTISSKSSI